MTRFPFATLAAAALAIAASAGAALSPRTAAPPIDLLETPAPQSPRAATQLMNSLVHAGERLVAAGARGTIVYSDDGGRSWSQATVPVAVMLTALHFPTPRLGWAVGHDGVILHCPHHLKQGNQHKSICTIYAGAYMRCNPQHLGDAQGTGRTRVARLGGRNQGASGAH